MKYLLLVIGFVAVILLDVPRLIRERKKREAFVVFTITATSFAVALLHIKGVKIPNPVDFVRSFTEWITDVLGLETFF